MSGYVRSTKFATTFEGHEVTATLAPLSFPDSLRLQGNDVNSELEAARVIAEILPTYVKDWKGPKDAEGNEVTIQEVCGTAYFGELVVELGRALAFAAKPSNPKPPSVPSAS